MWIYSNGLGYSEPDTRKTRDMENGESLNLAPRGINSQQRFSCSSSGRFFRRQQVQSRLLWRKRRRKPTAIAEYLWSPEWKIHHIYHTELLLAAPESGQNQRHVDMIWPLWNLLDFTPEGRGADWYPSLTYPL